MLNSRDIALLRPDVERNCRVWIQRCEENGLPVLVTSTVRDREYQEYLYAQGRTRAGSIVTNARIPTFHADTAGLAFDFCKNVKGEEYNDVTFFEKAAALAKEMGFSWGGDWKSFVDRPHIQWDCGVWTSAMIRAGVLPPAMPLWSEQNESEEQEMRYATIDDCPQWAQEIVQKLTGKGFLVGDGKSLDLSHDMVRLLVILDRAGVFEEVK